MTASAIVRTEGLGRSFGSRRALAGVDLELREGEIFALLGPNGGGKTTLFRILSTLLAPDAGKAFVRGHDVVSAAREVRRSIGVVFQSPSLDRELSVRENLVHQGRLQGLRGAQLTTRIDQALDALSLLDRAGDRVRELSGGLARRADVAKALLHSPPLLLLDEPSTGLDPVARADLMQSLKEARDRSGTTCLLTTHLMEEAEVCDRVGILDQGHLVAIGKPEELKSEIGGQVVTLTVNDAEGMAREMEHLLHWESVVEDGKLRMETDRGADLVPEILSAFPGRVTSATIASPSLADVFFRRTGRSFRAEGESA